MIKIYTGKFVVLKVCFFNQQSSISVPIRLKKKKNPITSIAVSKKKYVHRLLVPMFSFSVFIDVRVKSSRDVENATESAKPRPAFMNFV